MAQNPAFYHDCNGCGKRILRCKARLWQVWQRGSDRLHNTGGEYARVIFKEKGDGRKGANKTMDRLQEYLSHLSNKALIKLRRKVYRTDLHSLNREYNKMCEIIETAIESELLSRIGKPQEA